MKKIGYPHGLPTPHEAVGYMRIPLISLSLDVDLVGSHVNDVERVESAVTSDIPGTQEIDLVNPVSVQNLPEIWILNPLREIRSFF